MTGRCGLGAHDGGYAGLYLRGLVYGGATDRSWLRWKTSRLPASCEWNWLTDDLYPGLIFRGNNLDDMIPASSVTRVRLKLMEPVMLMWFPGTTRLTLTRTWREYTPCTTIQRSRSLITLWVALEGITLPPWDTTDLINQDIYMKFSAVTTPEGKVQLDGMMSMSADFSNPFGVISRLDDPLVMSRRTMMAVGAGQVGVAAMNAVGEGPVAGRGAAANGNDVAVYYEHAGPGDANGDGSVDDTDASILGANWLKQSGATWGMGDFNKDGKVNDQDAAIMAAKLVRRPGPARPVPEPGTLVLLASAAAVLCFRRRAECGTAALGGDSRPWHRPSSAWIRSSSRFKGSCMSPLPFPFVGGSDWGWGLVSDNSRCGGSTPLVPLFALVIGAWSLVIPSEFRFASPIRIRSTGQLCGKNA